MFAHVCTFPFDHIRIVVQGQFPLLGVYTFSNVLMTRQLPVLSLLYILHICSVFILLTVQDGPPGLAAALGTQEMQHTVHART